MTLNLSFGTYPQVHEDHDKSITPTYLWVQLNHAQLEIIEVVTIFSLNTGKILNSNHWTELQMPRMIMHPQCCDTLTQLLYCTSFL